MKIVVIVSADGEWEAVKSVLPQAVPERTLFGECFDISLDRWPVTFFHGGWGKVSAAASAQYVIDHFQPDLLVIDGGNSHFTDTNRRARALVVNKVMFMGLGVSGGESGARYGPSLMPGGRREAYDRVGPLLEAAAAHVNGDPCVAYLSKATWDPAATPTAVYEDQVREDITRGTLVPVLEEFSAPFPGFYLYFPRRRHASPALRAFVEFVRRMRGMGAEV